MTKKRDKIKKFKKENLIWIPRVLIIFYILFLSLFSLDTPFGIGLLIHLIPSLVLITILIFSWNSFWTAGILFGVFGFSTIFLFHTYRDVFSLMTISLIPILAGILFFIFKGKK
jgi:uncharacterized membrane protein